MDGAGGGGPAVPATWDVVYALLRDNAPLVRKLLEASPFIDPRGRIGAPQGEFFSAYGEFDHAATAPAAGAVRATVRARAARLIWQDGPRTGWDAARCG